MTDIRKGMNRRSALSTLGGVLAVGLTPMRYRLLAEEQVEGPTGEVNPIWLPKFWAESETRPTHAWENWEDLIYHDLDYPMTWSGTKPTESPLPNAGELMKLPEFRAFMQRNWVFNRAMRWHDAGLDGCIVCYSGVENLSLTGEHQVSAWHSDDKNSLTHSGAFTKFEKKADRRRDCAVLPAFQFHVGQHPKLELTVSEATGDWQFCGSIKGRSGSPFISTGWQNGSGKFSFDLAGELAKRGYNLNFAELHFVMGMWTKEPMNASSVTYQAELHGKPAIVTCLPVIRTRETATREGIPIAAVALNQQGERLGRNQVKLFALAGSQRIRLEENDGFWKGTLKGLKEGDYEVSVAAEGAIKETGTLHVRVTDGNYFTYDKEQRFIRHKGKLTGPLTGSYQGMFFFREVGQPSERIVNDQKEWDAWDRAQPPGERMHGWEALTERELEARFAYLQQGGWDLLQLHQHWGIWERLDGGGRIAPHGAEQLALYVRTAGRHGLASIQALSSGAYSVRRDPKQYGGTPTWTRYLDAGFKNQDWFEPDATIFNKMFHQYLHDFTSLFKEETALFAMTASGEGDSHNGLPRSNDVFHFIRSLDKSHLFFAEAIHQMSKLPQEYTAGWQQDMLGGRTYFIGEELLPEFDLGVEFKFYQLGQIYKAEGEWPSSNIYTQFHYMALKDDPAAPVCWAGSLRYRTRLRDGLYLGLVHRLPLILSWDEQMTADEHIVLRQVRELVDWSQAFVAPKVIVRVDGSNTQGKGRVNLAEYEKAFVHLPLAYQLILPDATPPGNAAVVIDARQPYQEPRFQADGGMLPDALKSEIPVRVSKGYGASYAWSEDRRTLLAYVYNVTHHIDQPEWACGRYHRIPKPTKLMLNLQNLPARNLKYRLYDLNGKKLLKEGLVLRTLSMDLGNTDRDYFVLVTPA